MWLFGEKTVLALEKRTRLEFEFTFNIYKIWKIENIMKIVSLCTVPSKLSTSEYDRCRKHYTYEIHTKYKITCVINHFTLIMKIINRLKFTLFKQEYIVLFFSFFRGRENLILASQKRIVFSTITSLTKTVFIKHINRNDFQRARR